MHRWESFSSDIKIYQNFQHFGVKRKDFSFVFSLYYNSVKIKKEDEKMSCFDRYPKNLKSTEVKWYFDVIVCQIEDTSIFENILHRERGI